MKMVLSNAMVCRIAALLVLTSASTAMAISEEVDDINGEYRIAASVCTVIGSAASFEVSISTSCSRDDGPTRYSAVQADPDDIDFSRSGLQGGRQIRLVCLEGRSNCIADHSEFFGRNGVPDQKSDDLKSSIIIRIR